VLLTSHSQRSGSRSDSDEAACNTDDAAGTSSSSEDEDDSDETEPVPDALSIGRRRSGRHSLPGLAAPSRGISFRRRSGEHS
jgi:hypothetical protein